MTRATTVFWLAPTFCGVGLRRDDQGLHVVLSEDRKRVILEAEASMDGRLTVQRVSEAIRLLGASFFQDLAAQKQSTRKLHDATAMTWTSTEAVGDEAEAEDEVLYGGDLTENTSSMPWPRKATMKLH